MIKDKRFDALVKRALDHTVAYSERFGEGAPHVFTRTLELLVDNESRYQPTASLTATGARMTAKKRTKRH